MSAVTGDQALQLGDSAGGLEATSSLVKRKWERAISTVLLTLFQVSLSLNTDEFVKAAQICSTPLKLCRHLQISATAVHFSKDKSDDVDILLFSSFHFPLLI